MAEMIKIVLLVIAYCLYPVLAALCYDAGAPFMFPVGLCFQTLLCMANFYIFEKKRFLILFDVILMGNVVLSNYIATYLYTSRVSNDPMSYAVGMWGAEGGVIYVFALSLILLIVHWKKSRANSRSCDKNI